MAPITDPVIGGFALAGAILLALVFAYLFDRWCARDRKRLMQEIEDIDSYFREQDERSDREYNEKLTAAIVGGKCE